MTLPELRKVMIYAAINSVAAMVMSLRWGCAEWTAYFMRFAGLAGALGCAASIIEQRIANRFPDEAEQILSKEIFSA